MLTCEICGEEIMLEEDMKTHLLLSHLENDMHCPLCSLSGVNYDELCLHISSAHPENQHTAQDPTHSTSSCSAGTNTGFTEEVKPQTSPSCSTGASCAIASGALSITTAPMQLRQSNNTTCILNRGASTSVEAASITTSTLSPKTKQGFVRHTPIADTAVIESEHNKAKQKRRSSPGNELFSCPLCALVCSSSFILQEHVELHLQEQHSAEELPHVLQPLNLLWAHIGHRSTPFTQPRVDGFHTYRSVAQTPGTQSPPTLCNSAGEKRFECPMCSVACSDTSSLQEHVELHLDSGAGSPGSDLELARKLQQELELRRREEEARREREEFKKLQRQFGLDGSGGFRRQMERTMERDVARGLMAPAEYHSKRADMLQSLASGIDDGRTRTQGVMAALYDYYQTEGRDSVHVWLSADTDHYCSSAGDKGWGCGYRNFQMLLSSLHRIDTYAAFLQEKAVPSIPRVQSMIEEAWKGGMDPQGASHFNQKLQGTRAWIGATEIYVLLNYLGVSGRMIDFHQPTGPGGTHPRLFDWVKQYFSQSSRSSRLPPKLIQTSLPPLYLQHQGHSRSVVGLEQKKNGSLCLLLFDPGCSPSDTRKLLSRDTVSTAIRHIRKFPGSLKHEQYQVVSVQGVLSAEEKQINILSSRTLCADRIP